MVTGAGGSIGSELVRQILASSPEHVSLVELCEYNLYDIARHCLAWNDAVSTSPLLVDIRHTYAVEKVFEQERPEVVFHAAALKHVPLLQGDHNMIEAVRTNVLGTKNVADNCARLGTKEMVLISTDKAVNPTNVMGLTKRAAELYTQTLGRARAGTHFVTVRFGNVAGSSGSVLPLFVEQVKQGGPVTVTSPEVTRFFMTIPEAVRLVLQASLLGMGQEGSRGAVYTLDMGEPLNIKELAEKVCRLFGREPGADIEVKVVGLRPGEKLFEELAYPYEDVTPTQHAGVNRASSDKWPQVSADWIALMKTYTEDRAFGDVRRLLSSLVPEYQEQKLCA